MTIFAKEAEFENAVIHELRQRGWGDAEVIKNASEADLLANWKQILFENNRGVDRLNEVPLTDGEMQQIMEQITALRTPLKHNGFINGKTVAITRDNPDDTLHFGKEVSLKIYDRHEIAAGQSRYQIVQQPRYARGSQILNDRRGDLLLLINGMPVIHIELKGSGVAASQAYNQIQKYSREGIFTGLFSLIQIFVAMEPAEALYFANPGPDGKFNKDYAFHWVTLSQGSKFHAIFATSSIVEAITYYRLMKVQCPELKITALFDSDIDNEDDDQDRTAFKSEGLVEILEDYNTTYGQKFDLGSHGNFKKDLAARLAHKAPYIRIEAEPDKRLDLLIVVNQMLTGFDSKWVNTLYLDKLLEYENIIQALSRTNRLFGPDKPFGTIRYYRKPHTMKRNFDAAVKLYSGDKPIGPSKRRSASHGNHLGRIASLLFVALPGRAKVC